MPLSREGSRIVLLGHSSLGSELLSYCVFEGFLLKGADVFCQRVRTIQ